MPKGKRLIPVSSDVVDELGKIANQIGMGIAELAEVILRHSVKILKTRSDVAKALREPLLVSDMKRLEVLVAPLHGFITLLSRVDEDSYQELVSGYNRLGRLVANILKVRGINDTVDLATVATTLFPFISVDVHNVSDHVEKIVMIAPQLGDEKLRRIVSTTIGTIASSLGYSVGSVEESEGVISISVSREGVEKNVHAT